MAAEAASTQLRGDGHRGVICGDVRHSDAAARPKKIMAEIDLDQEVCLGGEPRGYRMCKRVCHLPLLSSRRLLVGDGRRLVSVI